MSNYSKSLEGSKLKVERAKEHFRQLEAEIQTFYARKPYRIVVEEESQSGDQLYRVKIKKQPPPMWATIIGDTVHNLRSALDLLVNDAVRANGNTTNRDTGFPVYKSADAFEAGFSGKVRGVSTKAIKIIRNLKPYKDGNEALWCIHCLDITDKHRLILSVGSAYRNFNVVLRMRAPWAEGEIVKSPPISLKPADRLYPLKDGAVVMCAKAAARMADSDDAPAYKFNFEIAFGDGEIVQGEPVLPTLRQLIKSVEHVINIFARDVFSYP